MYLNDFYDVPWLNMTTIQTILSDILVLQNFITVLPDGSVFTEKKTYTDETI